MRKMILSAVVLLAACSATAQVESRWSLLPHVGLNISRLGGDDVPNYCGSKTGFSAGMEAELRFSRILGLSAGIDYTQLGCSTDETIEVIDEFVAWKYRYQAHNDCNRLRYLTLPVLLNVHIWQGLSFRIGVQPGWLEGARLKGSTVSVHSAQSETDVIYGTLVPTTDYVSRVTLYQGKRPAPLTADGIDNPVWERDDLNQGIRGQCHKMDLSLPVEVSYEWRGLWLGVGYQLGVTNVDKTEDEVFNRNLSIRAGYRIKL